ncbi:MAG: GC-type dockerin domain-anchored protein [Phycisphaerales bacterium]
MTRTHRSSRSIAGNAIAIALLAGTTNAMAPVNWDGEAGDLLWFSDDNWNPNGVPGEMDTVTIDSGGSVTAASMPIEVISVEALSGLELISSSLKVATDSMITDFRLGGCCTTPLDSGGGTITYLGNHVFDKAPAFIGSHVIQGTAIFNDLLFVEVGADLSIDAQATINGSGAQLRAGASASITGSLNLINSTLGSFSANPDATWYFDGGNLAYSGTQDAVISDKVFVTAGTVSADTKQMEFSEEFVFQDTEVVVSNGGRIVFDAGMPGLGGEFLGVNSFSGDGRIEIQGNAVDMGNTSSTTSVTGDGFWIRELLLIDGQLSNSGTMQLRGGTVDGDGRLTIEGGGTLDINFGGEINAETIVRSGGTITLNSQLTLANELRIDSGGLLDLNIASIRDESAGTGDPSAVTALGAFRVPSTTTADAIMDDVPLNLRTGGSVIIDDRRLILRGGGDLQGGLVTLTDTAASGFPRLLLNGSMSDSYTVGGGVEFTSSGNQAEILIGNGSSEQPAFEVDGLATFNLQGGGSTVDIRVNEVTGTGTSVLRNLGIMNFDRSATYSATVDNRGSLYITSATTFEHASLFNQADGSVIHRNTLILGDSASAINQGEWLVPLIGVQIILDFDITPGLTFFNNAGEMRFEGGSSFVDVDFNNNGTVIADGAQVSFKNATEVNSAGRLYLTGNWRTRNNGKILFPENPPTVVLGPNSQVVSDSDDMPALQNVEEVCEQAAVITSLWLIAKGRILFNGHSTLEVLNGGLFNAPGEIEVLDASEIVINPGATVESDTSISIGSDDIKLPSVTDDITGVIQLSLGDVPPPTISAPIIDIHANLTPIRNDVGVMNTAGTLTIHPTGTLRINARADGLSSSIDHTGDLEITGSISITPLKAYEPQVGDSFTIATVSGTIGTLPSGAIDASGSGIAYAVNAIGSDIVVTVIQGCPADLTMDGEINFFDVSAFLTAFNSMDPIADFNNDELFNFFDVSAFLSAYNAGCP